MDTGVGMRTGEHCISTRLPTCLLDSGLAAQSILRTKNFHSEFFDSLLQVATLRLLLATHIHRISTLFANTFKRTSYRPRGDRADPPPCGQFRYLSFVRVWSWTWLRSDRGFCLRKSCDHVVWIGSWMRSTESDSACIELFHQLFQRNQHKQSPQPQIASRRLATDLLSNA